MTKINKISFGYIKGIKNKDLKFMDMHPNMLHLLIASNGFGKSSLTQSFLSLKKGKLEIPKHSVYMDEKHATNSFLSINYGTKQSRSTDYIADKNENKISGFFDIHIINSPLHAKTVTKRINGFNNSTAKLSIQSIIIKNSIPPKIKMDYSIKNEIYTQYKKIFPSVASMKDFIDQEWDFLYENRTIIISFVTQVGTKKFFNKLFSIVDLKKTSSEIANNFDINTVKKIITSNKIDEVITNISTLNIHIETMTDLQKYLLLYYISLVFNYNSVFLSKINKYKKYETFRITVNTHLKLFNTTGREIVSQVEKNKLFVKFKDADEISFGERDLLSFIIKLLQIKEKLSNKPTILLIDEIFDYLDGANMLVVQSLLSELIKYSKKHNFVLYPLILTHLDPDIFKVYNLKNIKNHYLENFSVSVNGDMQKFIIRRTSKNESDRNLLDKISRYFLHYNNEDVIINDSDYDTASRLKGKFLCSKTFRKDNYSEIYKFVHEENYKYCPLTVVCGIRVMVEEVLFRYLPDSENQTFITTYKTVSKIEFLENKGIEYPEVCKILHPIYNESLHITSKDDSRKINSVSFKLQSKAVKMIVGELYKEWESSP